MNTTTTPAAPRQRRPRQKPARTVRLCVKPTEENVGVVRLTVGAESADYLLSEIPGVAFGRGFFVEKIGFQCDESNYHVNVNGRLSSCECKGFDRWGRCKHIDGLAALIERGRL